MVPVHIHITCHAVPRESNVFHALLAKDLAFKQDAMPRHWRMRCLNTRGRVLSPRTYLPNRAANQTNRTLKLSIPKNLACPFPPRSNAIGNDSPPVSKFPTTY